jgi:hypothetical protein
LNVCNRPECQTSAGCAHRSFVNGVQVTCHFPDGTNYAQLGLYELLSTNELLRLKGVIETILHRRILGDPAVGVTIGGPGPVTTDTISGTPDELERKSRGPFSGI